MNRAEKIESAKELSDCFGKAKAIYVSDFRGITVEQITKFRFELKKSNTDLKVVKNRVALRAMADKNFDTAFKAHFDYMTAVALNYGDPSACAKALTNFAKDCDKVKIKGGLVEGKVVNLAQIKALSSLPSRNELLAKLLGTLQAVPTGFVRVLNGVPSKWVYLLEALRRQKEGKG